MTEASRSAGPAATSSDGVVRGAPRRILRLEGAVLFVGAVVAYAAVGGGWRLFALLFLAPDLFMLGYLANSRVGAALYNLGHATIAPALLIGIGLWASVPALTAVGLIWAAHVGFDRAVGYGLKYPDAFRHTHLGAPSA